MSVSTEFKRMADILLTTQLNMAEMLIRLEKAEQRIAELEKQPKTDLPYWRHE